MDLEVVIKAYNFGPVTDTVPNEVSGGRIAVLSHCLLMFSVTLKLDGVVVGAAGNTTELDVAAGATCRGRSPPWRRTSKTSSVGPKSRVALPKVLFQGTRDVIRVIR